MSDEHDWLGDLPGVKDIQDAAGITYPRRARLRFEGATVADDPVNGRTVVSVPGSGSQPPIGPGVEYAFIYAGSGTGGQDISAAEGYQRYSFADSAPEPPFRHYVE